MANGTHSLADDDPDLGPISVPSVELMRGSDALEFPEISLGEAHGFGVSASEALSHISVVESLTVAKLVVAEGETKSEAEQKSTSHLHVVSIEVSIASSGLVIGERADRADNTANHSGGSTEDLVHVLATPELHVEVLWVVLDEFSTLDLSAHGLIRLLHIVLVTNDMRAVSSHFTCYFC